MGSYNLKWPGFSYMPLYYIDKESNDVYHEAKPIPTSKSHLAIYHNQYVSLDDVMALFSTRTMINASQQLILLNENVDTNQMFKDDETGELFMHLNTLLAFLIVFPFCPEFQRARSAVLQYLMNFCETTCIKCGFIQRDCKCTWKPSIISKTDTGPVELVGTIRDLATSSTQTDVITCPICKDPKAFKEAKHPVLVLPPGNKVNKGEKFSFTMPTRAGVVQMDPVVGSGGTPAMLTPDTISNLNGSSAVPSSAVPSTVPPISASAIKITPMSSMPPLSLSLPAACMAGMSHTAPVLPGMYNTMPWPGAVPPNSALNMPGSNPHPYLHGLMPVAAPFPPYTRPVTPTTTLFPPYTRPVTAPTTSSMSLTNPSEQPVRYSAVGGYRYASPNPPLSWKPLHKKTPEEIRQEEEIRRKKKGMVKLFKDQFILAKPGKKKKKKKDKEKKQNIDDKLDSVKNVDEEVSREDVKGEAKEETDKPNGTEQSVSPCKEEKQGSVKSDADNKEESSDDSRATSALGNSSDIATGDVKNDPASAEVKDEMKDEQVPEESLPDSASLGVAKADDSSVAPGDAVDDVKSESAENLHEKNDVTQPEDKLLPSDESAEVKQTHEDEKHDALTADKSVRNENDSKAPEENEATVIAPISDDETESVGTTSAAPESELEVSTPAGESDRGIIDRGEAVVELTNPETLAAVSSADVANDQINSSKSNGEDKTSGVCRTDAESKVVLPPGVERSLSAPEARRPGSLSLRKSTEEETSISLRDEDIAAQALSELFAGAGAGAGASTPSVTSMSDIPSSDVNSASPPSIVDAKKAADSPHKSNEVDGGSEGSVTSGSVLGNLSLLDEIMQNISEEEKKVGDETSTVKTLSGDKANDPTADSVSDKAGSALCETKKQENPTDAVVLTKDDNKASENAKSETAGGTSSETKDDEKDDGLSEMNKCEHDSLMNYDEQEVPSALIKKGYAAFEFVPTGERMIRCVLFGCGQCFDTEEFAKIHVKCHEPKGHGLQCYVCNKFTVPTTKWYHMLRHLQSTHKEAQVETELHCTFCGLQMADSSKLEEHVHFHHYSQYKCIHCAEQLFTWNHVQHHLAERCPEKTKGHFYYSCPYCHFVFHSPQIHQLHIKSHIDEGLICCICKDNLPWGTWKTLKKHYLSFHMSKDAKKLVKCMKCRMQFSSMDTYTKHVEQRHSKPAAKKPAPKEEVVNEPPRKKMKRIRRSTAKSDMFDYNDRDNTDESQEEEDEKHAENEKAPVSEGTSQSKKEKKKSKEDKAPVLEPGEIPREDLEDKENEAAEEKPVRVPSPEPPPPPPSPPPPPPPPEVLLNCDKCSKTFRTQRRLDLHQENAHGEVQCEKCDYVAKNKHMLKSHIQAKHSEKEHACTECSKSFDHFYQLKIHLAAHARNIIYPCKVCKAEFNSSKDLRVHQREEHPDEANKAQQMCMECTFQCYSKTTLKIHMRKKHPELCDDDDSVDHCYFNRKLDPPAPPEPKSRYKRRVDTAVSTPNRGRPKSSKVKAKAALRRGGRMSKAALREERKRKDREKKERSILDQLKKLRRASCARTRSFDEYQIIRDDDTRRGEINLTIAAGSSQTNVTAVRPRTYSPLSYARMRKPSYRESEDDEEFTDIRTGRVNRQSDIDIKPIELDHCYYKTTETVLREMMQSDSFMSDTSDPGTGMSIVNTPDVGEFQDCLTAPIPRASNPQPSTMWSNFDSLVEPVSVPSFQVQPPPPPILSLPVSSAPVSGLQSPQTLPSFQSQQTLPSFQSPLGQRKVVVQRVHGGDVSESSQGGIYVRKFEKFPKLSVPQIQPQTVRDPFQCSPDMRIVRLENPGGPRIMRIERVNRAPPPDMNPQSNNLSKLVAALSEGEQVMSQPMGVPSLPVMSSVSSNLNFVSQTLGSFTHTQPTDTFSVSNNSVSQTITNYATTPPVEDEHNLSSGSHAESLGDFDESNLLMGDADMQDILQQAVQVLQDNSGLDTSFEDMEAVQNIDI